MCGGIEYQGHKVFFPNPEARLPVRTKDGGVTWLPWGSRNRMDHTFPNGGWARLESIKQGKWRAWHPRPVLIACDHFMEKDEEGVSHWFAMEAHMVIQGLVAERNEQQRIYVVTEPPPPEYAWIHDRYLREDIVEFNAQRKKNLISLNETDRRKEREAQEAKIKLREKDGAADKGAKSTRLQDDGLQSNERNLNDELAIEKARKEAKDIFLNEAAHILSDEAGLLQPQTLGQGITETGVVCFRHTHQMSMESMSFFGRLRTLKP